MRTLAKTIAAAFVVLLLVSGCQDSGPSTKVFVEGGDAKRLRVAVLPFDNVSKDQDAGRVITNTVITYLLSTGSFDVVEPGVVNAAMSAEGIRTTEGITLETCQKLQPRLNADAFIVGMTEEYGDVQIGSDSYPSISFSARLVDARTANILWAATISKTGADNVKIFDIGRVSSLGKLSKQAVAAMANSLFQSRTKLMADLQGSQPAPVGSDTGRTTETVKPGAPVTASGSTATSTAAAPPGSAQAKYLDEAATYGEKDLTALLKDVGTYKLGDVTYKKHFHDTIETKYQIGDKGKFVELRLVDYLTTAISGKFLQTYNTDYKQTTFETLPAFSGESSFGYYHLDVSVGRFCIFLRGPKDNKADIDALGKGLIALLT
jgi:polysaccharide biosynthesis protein PelC